MTNGDRNDEAIIECKCGHGQSTITENTGTMGAIIECKCGLGQFK